VVTISSSGMRTQRNSMYSGGSADAHPLQKETQANEATSVPVMFPSPPRTTIISTSNDFRKSNVLGCRNVYRCAYSPPARRRRRTPR